MSATVRFQQRFQGFTDGALGGYAAGVVASRIGGAVEANLRSLPPLERDLEVRGSDDSSLALWDGETLVLEAAGADFALDLPEPVGLEEAELANSDLVHEHGHLYPDCFTCGPSRSVGDGLRLFMGYPPGRTGILASAWTPDPGLAPAPALPEELVWAAMDCPTIWAAWLTDDGRVVWPEGRFTVLARYRVEQLAPVPTGEASIVTRGRSTATAAST